MDGKPLSYCEKYAFLAEWYNATAEITKSFLLSFYPFDQTLELYDLHYRRLFLRRTKVDGVTLKSLHKGAVVTIFSRHINIVDYANESTRNLFNFDLQKIFFLIKPDGIKNAGDILKHLESNGFTLTRLKMGCISKNGVPQFLGNLPTDSPMCHQITEAMSEGPSIGVEAIAENGRTRWLEVAGPINPDTAREEAPGSLRAIYGTDLLHNAIHTSADISDTTRESEFWFQRRLGRSSCVSSSCRFSNSTCCVIKPHAVEEGVVGSILNLIKDNGFDVTAMEMFHLDRAAAEDFYEVYKGVLPEYSSMVTHLSSGPCIALEVVDKNNPAATAVSFREFIGPKEPTTAKNVRPESVRAKFGSSTVLNAVHCTDLPEDAAMEVEFFFKILQR